ncbi:MAG TPA: cysteine desulfurase family protein [Rhodocyclaceae bacterium]|jgi:cysteine desulfurase|nr:cysteine desulfurase family protein [Rhodocyclaceae bacterium]HMV20541.1 cysteine desulfurase family protein [Rhodocyclaceae bacterium]HMW77447.1 cysteine desulfurase family protein [Rhodocyclaceae bacterium]HNE41841.1 cysteine desulfurase family protein [Rhodocyclaceae bacterium]HNL20678.1 cysteine desulfurase family protein [Rhodocyclaceae bacterium]
MFRPIYLDHNATTPVDPAVLEAMLPWLGERWGNPSSRHEYGREARRAVDDARQRVAVAVGAHPTEIVFTSGGSEANNLFLKGAAASRRPGVIAIGACEHPSVRRAAAQLSGQGWRLQEIAVEPDGQFRSTAWKECLLARPTLISVMVANNETGVVQDIAALAAEAQSTSAWFHTDGVQALGKLPLDFRTLNRAGVHGMTVSGHKIGGPKGAAALVLDKRVELQPLVAGGGQERDLRSGTENVAAIVGLGLACERAVARIASEAVRLSELRERLERGLAHLGATVFGTASERLPNTSFFAFSGIDGETLVGKLDRAGYAVASGSACSSADPEPSHVLAAMGVSADLARGAVRVSFGRNNAAEEIDGLLSALGATVGSLRGLTAVAA